MTSPFSALPKRPIILGGVMLLLMALLIARWIADWGLVTIHVKDASLSKVIASIARQGHVHVESSLDPGTPVSIDVEKVTPAQAIDIVSIRTDASWRVVYLAANSQADINAALIILRGTGKIDNWATHFYPGFSPLGESGQAIDPRSLSLQIEGSDQDLPKILDEAAQKSGVMTALPQSWNPTVQKLPKTNRVSKVIPALISSAHGKVAEFFFISERRRQRENTGAEEENSAWREQRQLAEIQLLPPAEQDAAKKRRTDRQALFAQMKGLSPEERRAKWQQIMSNPDMLQQMQDQQLLRQANQTPEQRINRAVNYLNRKSAQGH